MVRQIVDVEKYMVGPRNVPLSQKYHYNVFVKATLAGKVFPWKRPSDAEISHVYNQLLNYFAATAESDEQFLREREQIRKTWPRMRQIMRKCPGLVSFMKEYGVHSRFFYPFLLDVPKGIAMLPAYFMGRDIFGTICPIPFSDAMYQFCMHDHVFQSVRFRTEYEQQYLKTAAHPLALGAGTLPQLWYDGYKSESAGQKIDAYDSDLELKDHLRQVFGDDLASYGINYHFESFEAAFVDEHQWHKHDLVTAMGLASYYLKDLDHLLGGMKQCLAPDGIILLDLQLMDPALIFDLLVLNWKTEPMIQLCKNAKEAIDYVHVACDHLGLSIDESLIAPNGAAGIVFKISKR